MLKIFDKIIFLITLVATCGLLGAYASYYINPNSFALPSLLGLAYPYLLIGNFILLLYWITRWKRTAWLEIIVIALGYPTFTTYYGTAGNGNKKQPYELSLMSYNVRYFDVYNWSEQKDTKKRLYQYLNRFDGDVICFQEFSTHADTPPDDALLKQLRAYPYRYIRKDMAIFSKWPLRNKGNLSLGSPSASCLYCDLVKGKDTIRLYNVHLESYKLGKKERKFMQEISKGLNTNELSEGARNLFSRLTTANKNRARQARQIHQHISRNSHQVILCGDFNDTPLSYTYHEMKKGMQDAFTQKGRGLGNTYIGEFPSFRIDYILHTPGLETTAYTRDTVRLSDHYPIYAKLKFKKTEKHKSAS